MSDPWEVYVSAVRAYLAYCKRAAAELKLQGSQLDKRYHPTADGACRLVYGDARLIREAYKQVTNGSEEGAAA